MLRGSKSRNKVSVGEPAEGSLTKMKLDFKRRLQLRLGTEPCNCYSPVALLPDSGSDNAARKCWRGRFFLNTIFW